jgi:hypothetical protein
MGLGIVDRSGPCSGGEQANFKQVPCQGLAQSPFRADIPINRVCEFSLIGVGKCRSISLLCNPVERRSLGLDRSLHAPARSWSGHFYPTPMCSPTKAAFCSWPLGPGRTPVQRQPDFC